jgi:hypothetical protein
VKVIYEDIDVQTPAQIQSYRQDFDRLRGELHSGHPLHRDVKRDLALLGVALVIREAMELRRRGEYDPGDNIRRYLAENPVADEWWRLYSFPADRDVPKPNQLVPYRLGNTSLIFTALSDCDPHRRLAIKCVLPPYLRSKAIEEATRNYRKRYEGPTASCLHWARCLWSTDKVVCSELICIGTEPASTVRVFVESSLSSIPVGKSDTRLRWALLFARRLIEQLTDALICASAHSGMLGHLDITPDNILVVSPVRKELVLAGLPDPSGIDFLLIDAGQSYIGSGLVMAPGEEGALEFAAPELRGGTAPPNPLVGAKADAYSIVQVVRYILKTAFGESRGDILTLQFEGLLFYFSQFAAPLYAPRPVNEETPADFLHDTAALLVRALKDEFDQIINDPRCRPKWQQAALERVRRVRWHASRKSERGKGSRPVDRDWLHSVALKEDLSGLLFLARPVWTWPRLSSAARSVWQRRFRLFAMSLVGLSTYLFVGIAIATFTHLNIFVVVGSLVQRHSGSLTEQLRRDGPGRLVAFTFALAGGSYFLNISAPLIRKGSRASGAVASDGGNARRLAATAGRIAAVGSSCNWFPFVMLGMIRPSLWVFASAAGTASQAAVNGLIAGYFRSVDRQDVERSPLIDNARLQEEHEELLTWCRSILLFSVGLWCVFLLQPQATSLGRPDFLVVLALIVSGVNVFILVVGKAHGESARRLSGACVVTAIYDRR